MEQILVKQSIALKCKLGSSRLVGNYEYYYAGGMLCRLAGQLPPPGLLPKQLEEHIRPLLESYIPQNEEEKVLVAILKDYELHEDYDSQMEELLRMGTQEKK